MDTQGFSDEIKKLFEDSKVVKLHDLIRIFGAEPHDEERKISVKDRNLLNLMKDISSLRLSPDSINEPFQPLMQWSDGRRSAMLCDFTPENLKILISALDIVSHPQLKIRIYDLLWTLHKPRNPAHARAAIDGYISNDIALSMWRNGGDKEYERAYRLAKTIKDLERIQKIDEKLNIAIHNDDLDEILIYIAETIVKIGALKELTLVLAERLKNIGLKYKKLGKYQHAIRILGFSAYKYTQGKDNDNNAGVIAELAHCYASHAKDAFESGVGQRLISAGLIETAVQAFRKVPKEYREHYSVDVHIFELRKLLDEAGLNIIESMPSVKIPIEDADTTIQFSKDQVSNRASVYEALMCFSFLWECPNYEIMKEAQKKNSSQNLLSSFFAPIQYSTDGRVTAKAPTLGLDSTPEEVEVFLKSRTIQSFSHDIKYIVNFFIFPALQQLLLEHSVSRYAIYELCKLSPLVPEQSLTLISRAIWLGFEFEFATAIYLIAPLMETIVRHQLKAIGAITAVLDANGIQQEAGLSTLLDIPEAVEVFGVNHLFELKAVFADSMGANLRNEVAHGLLSDSAAHSEAPVYAWWVLLRVILHSTIPFTSSTDIME